METTIQKKHSLLHPSDCSNQKLVTHPTSHPAHQLSVWIIQSLFYLNLILKYSLQHKQHCCPPGVQFHVLCRQVHRAKNQPIQVLTLLLTFSEEKGTTEDEMAGWHRWLDGRNSEWTPGVGDGQGGLARCDSWGRKESDTTERLNRTELTELISESKMYSWERNLDLIVKHYILF